MVIEQQLLAQAVVVEGFGTWHLVAIRPVQVRPALDQVDQPRAPGRHIEARRRRQLDGLGEGRVPKGERAAHAAHDRGHAMVDGARGEQRHVTDPERERPGVGFELAALDRALQHHDCRQAPLGNAGGGIVVEMEAKVIARGVLGELRVLAKRRRRAGQVREPREHPIRAGEAHHLALAMGGVDHRGGGAVDNPRFLGACAPREGLIDNRPALRGAEQTAADANGHALSLALPPPRLTLNHICRR